MLQEEHTLNSKAGKYQEEKERAEDIILETEWSMYAHFPCGSSNYGIAYKKIGSFSTVCDFWRLYNNIPTIEHIHDNQVRHKGVPIVAYSMFRNDVKPEWEDPINIKGSEWGCRESLDKKKFSQMWNEYVLGAIGEKIPHCVGIRAINKSNKQRSLHKIEIWMDKTDTPSIQECRRSLNAILSTSPKFVHMPHQDKQNQAQEYLKKRRKS